MNENLKYWFLRDHNLFSTLNYGQIKHLCIVTGFKKAKKGEVLYFSDDRVPKIYFLKKGHIKITSITENGDENIKEIIHKNDLFGEFSSEVKEVNEVAIALTDDVIICSFLLSDFENLMLKYPNLALSYTKFIGFKIKKWKNNYKNLVFLSANSRLCLFLIDWANRDGRIVDDEIFIENFLTQNEIAQIICTSRQTTILLLNELELEQIISYSRKEIKIKSIEKLKKKSEK